MKKTGLIFLTLLLFGCLFERDPPDRSGIIGKWVYDDSSAVAHGIVNFRYKVLLTIDEKYIQYDLYLENDGFKDGFDGTWSLKGDLLTLQAETCYLPDSAGVKKNGDCGFYHSGRKLLLFWDGASIYSEVDGEKYFFKKE
ncbi:MAG: hypothetical protein ABI036_01600 [Fibrobacteria bacterium]